VGREYITPEELSLERCPYCGSSRFKVEVAKRRFTARFGTPPTAVGSLRAKSKRWSGRSSTASGALTAARTFQRKLAFDAFSAMAITA
jgi:DNA-directed RNA polymerase subunit RPC12/RpoP